MFSEHISGASRTVVIRSSTLSRGLPPVVSWMIASRLGAQPVVQLGVDRRVHRVRPVGVARVHVQHRRARLPRGDALLDDLVRLLRQRRVGLLAVDPARQRTGDDDRIGARPPGQAQAAEATTDVDQSITDDGLTTCLFIPSSFGLQPQGEPEELGKVQHRHVQRPADDAGRPPAAAGPG